MAWFKKKSSPGKQLVITPPPPQAGRDGIAIVACVKNEASYIVEWVRFHRAVGVRHFYVYDDGSQDATRDILARILPPEALTIVPWISRMIDVSSQDILNGQAIAFAHAILNFGALYRWMAFIDVDEFLLPKTGRTVEDALEGAGAFPNISLPWHMFGTSGHKTRPEGPLCLNYTMRNADPMSREEHVSNFKCIVDPCAVVEVSVHQFKTLEFDDLTANDQGQRFSRRGRKEPEFYSSRFLQLNHYYSKSQEELRAKIDRGWSYAASRQKLEDKILTTVRNIEADMVEDRAMIDFIERNGIDLGQ
jgi:hypothetical protein